MKKLALLLILIASPAFAQGQPPVPNPQEQIALAIGNLFVANTNLTAQLQQVRADLEKAQARIKELEPKPDVPK